MSQEHWIDYKPRWRISHRLVDALLAGLVKAGLISFGFCLGVIVATYHWYKITLPPLPPIEGPPVILRQV